MALHFSVLSFIVNAFYIKKVFFRESVIFSANLFRLNERQEVF